MGATLLYPLVGVATATDPATPRLFLWALATGVLFHVYADVGNDVMDLPIDRTDPRRAPSPLVREVISPPAALLIAVAALPPLLATTIVLDLSAASAPLLAAVVLIGLYNLAGKSLPIPFVADVVQGAGWASLVLAGGAAAGGVTAATGWAAGAVLAYVALVNGVHGAVRDAVNDRRSGARTTALLLGADIEAQTRIVLPAPLAVWGAALHLLFGVTAGAMLLAAANREASAWAAVVALAVYAAATVSLLQAYASRDDLRRAMARGTWHLFLLPATLLLAAASQMTGAAAVATATAYVLPPVFFGWTVRDSEFGLPSTVRSAETSRLSGNVRQRIMAMWDMTRPGTPLAAAALVVVGSLLAGRLTGEALALMVAAACAVAAANVFNDRCDRVADEINRPERPLVTGPVDDNDADRFVLSATIGSIGSAALAGGPATFATAVLIFVALGYSLLLRRTVLGHLTVAALFAAPLVYGGWFGGGSVTAEHAVAAGLVTLFVFGRETLKGVPDRRGDMAAGYRTIATALGEAGALTVFRWTSGAFCLAAVGASLVAADIAYLAAALVCAVVPTLRTLQMVSGRPSLQVVDRAVQFSGLVFLLGVIPLLLLG